MEIEIIRASLDEIQDMRVLFLHENNFQFIYDKCHYYGWADRYMFMIDDAKIGYGAVWGKNNRQDRDAIFEFYLLPPYRKSAGFVFGEFRKICKAAFIECQGNDTSLYPMLYENAQNINAEAILFREHFQTDFSIAGTALYKKDSEEKSNKDDRRFILKKDDEVVATGGLMLNYNIPYADIYYEVNEQYRRKGYGTLIVQELKKAAYLLGRLPAARCNINNQISKATLLKAGFIICGHILTGELKT